MQQSFIVRATDMCDALAVKSRPYGFHPYQSPEGSAGRMKEERIKDKNRIDSDP